MTDIQSLLNIVSTPSNELEQSTLSQLTQSQLTQVKQLQQLLQQLNLPPKASQQLISALMKETVNVTNLSVTDNKLSFTLSQLTPKLVELTIPSQPLQLQTDKAQLSVKTNLSELLINLPKQSIKLPHQVIFQLFKLATNSAETTQGKFAIPAQITNLDKHLLVKANHVAISAELPKSLASLVKHQQPAIIEVESKREQLSLNIKLDKHSQPVQSQVLPIKKAIELVKLQSPLLQFDAKKTPALSINNSPVVLTNIPQVITNQKLTFNLNNLGDKAVLNLPSQVFKVALNTSQSPLKIAPRELISAPQLAVKELPIINSVNATQKSFSQSVIAPMLASIKAVLFERSITLNHATKGSVNLPKLDITNTLQIADSSIKQDVTPSKLPLLTAISESQQKAAVYSRPVRAALLQHQDTDNSKGDITTRVKANVDIAKPTQLSLEAIAKQNPLHTLATQLNKTAASPLLPEALTKLVNSAFSRMINESTALQPVVMQIKSIIAPAQITQFDSLQTPIGIIEHAKISLAANGLLQQNNLVSEQQGKLENLLPLLLSLTKGLQNKKESKSLKGQLTLPGALQKSLSDNLTSLQKNLQGTFQSSSQQASNNEQPLVNIQFALPQQQTEKLTTTPITIEQEQRKMSNGEVVSIWHINLAFEIENYILNIGAELNKQQLALNFSSDSAALINKAKTQAQLLEQKLTQHGIEILSSEFNLTEQHQLKTRSGIVNIKV
ncbi:hypothetical protein [Pseudoalteromonas sp. G4]|uniref:hypothetical protein n=1 Tax=Pseudoalteromonas sp. G4 TaxID=2992761 RepID=UPI00237DE238|nr:hypothetical protein [Pseudoalteromonas sp. G4]MDE3271152.1 hypothetical protein [Pseudoalteromonas sp. G4]